MSNKIKAWATVKKNVAYECEEAPSGFLNRYNFKTFRGKMSVILNIVQPDG